MMKISYYRKMLSTDDLVFGPIYFVAILLIAFFVRGIIVRDGDPLRKYFIPGLAVKLIGAAFVGVIYFFYYGGGDTTEYYNNSIVLYEAFSDSPYYFLRLLMAPPNYDDPAIMTYKWWMYFHRDPQSWFYGKIASVLTMFAFNVYTPTALLMAVVSYSGVWALYVTLCRIYPDMYKKFALAVLFIPSVFFWGSGLLKDSMTFACVGWMTYATYHVFFRRRKVFLNLLVLALATYICLKIKPYIVFSISPAFIFWIFLHYRNTLQSPFLRFSFGPIAVMGSILFGFLIVRQLGSEYSAYSLEKAVKTAKNYQDWHDWLAENQGASGYSLGDIDGSFVSIVKTFPAAVNVTLFRPYLWETRNPVMLLSALESMLMLLFTLRIFFRTGIRYTFVSLGRNPTAFFCIFFSLFFAFCVGFTAYNFGALVRYKIPCIPFFVAGLMVLDMQTQQDIAKRKERRVKHRHLSLDPV